MSGYIGTKSVTLSTTSASVGGDSTVGGDLTVDTNTLYVDSTNNRVGIGTSSPDASYKMTIESTASEAGIRVQGDSARIAVWENGSSSIGDGPNFYMQNISGGTYAASMQMGAASEILFFQYPNAGAWYERMRIDGSGNLLVATTTNPSTSVTTQAFRIGPVSTGVQMILSGSETSSYAKVSFNNGNGQVGFISTSGSSTSYSTSSDHRLKENVTNVTDGITRVKQLEPKRFNFIADPDRTVDGFLAHEAQAVVPEAVTGTHNEVDDDGNAVMQGIDQSKLVPLLTAALKESIAKIEALEARVTALEGN